MRSVQNTGAWYCLIIGSTALLLGIDGMPIGLLVLAGVVTACGLNAVLRGERGRPPH